MCAGVRIPRTAGYLSELFLALHICPSSIKNASDNSTVAEKPLIAQFTCPLPCCFACVLLCPLTPSPPSPPPGTLEHSPATTLENQARGSLAGKAGDEAVTQAVQGVHFMRGVHAEEGVGGGERLPSGVLTLEEGKGRESAEENSQERMKTKAEKLASFCTLFTCRVTLHMSVHSGTCPLALLSSLCPGASTCPPRGPLCDVIAASYFPALSV